MGVKRYKVKGSWRWKNSFKQDGVKHRKQGFESRAKAVEWEVQERERLKQVPTDSLFFGELGDEYITYCRAWMRHNTVRQKHHVYRKFIEHIGGDRAIEEVTARDIGGYILDLAGWNAKTANRHLRDIKALYNWAFEQDRITGRNPCRGIKRLPEDPHNPYIPPTEDYKAVLLVASRDEQDFLETLYHTVSRRREILRLTWQDVDLEKGWIRTYTRKRQGGALEPMSKPINSALMRTLKARFARRDRRVQKVFSFEQKTLDRMMPELCAQAKVKPFGFHALRHLAASELNRSGASIKVIQLLCGHKKQTTTEIYIHALDDALKEAVEVLGEEKSERAERSDTS